MADFIMEDIEIEEDQEYVITDPDLYGQRYQEAIQEQRYDDAVFEAEKAVEYGNNAREYQVIKLKALFESGRYQDCIDYIDEAGLWYDRGELNNELKDTLYRINAECLQYLYRNTIKAEHGSDSFSGKSIEHYALSQVEKDKITTFIDTIHNEMIGKLDKIRADRICRDFKEYLENETRGGMLLGDVITALGDPCEIAKEYIIDEAQSQQLSEEKELSKISYIKRLAEDGDTEAQAEFGILYANGDGEPEDRDLAVKWLKSSAMQDNASGMYGLGLLFHKGIGLPPDIQKAIKLYYNAASKGEIRAQYHLGFIYYTGEDVELDYAKALEWFKKGAEQGDPHSQNMLARMYYSGEGVSQNYKTAAEWLKKAAEQGYAQAEWGLGALYENGDGVNKDDRKAFELIEKSAKKGIAAAQCHLGQMYEHGIGIEKNESVAAGWYRRAIKHGYEDAYFSLGLLYCTGKGVEPSMNKAFELFLRAANLGIKKAQYNVALFYEKGAGTGQDIHKALEWYIKAAEQEDGEIKTKAQKAIQRLEKQYNLKLSKETASDKDIINKSQRNPSDKNSVLNELELLANNGDTDALFKMGILYSMGDGVKQDEERALEYFKEAADAGHTGARIILNNYEKANNGNKPYVTTSNSSQTKTNEGAASTKDTYKKPQSETQPSSTHTTNSKSEKKEETNQKILGDIGGIAAAYGFAIVSNMFGNRIASAGAATQGAKAVHQLIEDIKNNKQ